MAQYWKRDIIVGFSSGTDFTPRFRLNSGAIETFFGTARKRDVEYEVSIRIQKEEVETTTNSGSSITKVVEYMQLNIYNISDDVLYGTLEDTRSNFIFVSFSYLFQRTRPQPNDRDFIFQGVIEEVSSFQEGLNRNIVIQAKGIRRCSIYNGTW